MNEKSSKLSGDLSTSSSAVTEHADLLPFRPNVGLMVLNPRNEIWIGRRVPLVDHRTSQFLWQMPQGGIDEGETPQDAAFRELYEETGMTSVEIIGESQHWYSYTLPDHLVGVALDGKFRGQTQRWFVLRFFGDDSEIDIHDTPADADSPEFDQWRWAGVDDMLSAVVHFKRPVYEKILREFAHVFE